MYLLTALKDILLDVKSLLAGGNTANETSINKFGEQVDIDTADVTGALTQVIWPVKRSVQDYPFIDSPVSLTITSTSVNDIVGGTGAQTVFVTYHDNNGSAQVIELDMNGTGTANIPTTSYGVFRIEIGDSGALNTNDGTITVNGPAGIYAIVEAGEGQTLMAVQRIPNSFASASVKYARATYARSGVVNEATLRLKIRKANGTKLTKLNVNLFSGLTDFTRDFRIGGITVAPGDWVYWECTDVSANDTPIAGYFDIVEHM